MSPAAAARICETAGPTGAGASWNVPVPSFFVFQYAKVAPVFVIVPAVCTLTGSPAL